MKIPVKKLKMGFAMPVLGLGTWMMGGDKIYNPKNDDEADIKAIKNALKIGITHIDTAENYAQGYAEKLVGRAIKNYPRKKLILVSKVDSCHLSYKEVIASCRASLKRLQTNYLDLYLIHSPNLSVPLSETFKALDKLVKDDLVKYLGVSNFALPRLKKAQSLTKNKIVTNQVHYNLIFREPERTGLLKYCQENDIFLTAWRPLQKGLLIEKEIPLIKKICQKYQKTPNQIALNWLVSQKNVVTLSKMGQPKHLKENLGAVNWQMEKEDLETLRQRFPGQEAVSNTFALV